MSSAPSYPPELPVSQKKDDIARAIAENQVVVVAGATGSGKTTQLPKICLELGRTSIGHTQPRRIAARTVAERIADETETELGTLVGYQVRFTDRVSDDTRIKLMTDGILLNEIHRDRMLRAYDTIIIDEAHERSLNIDFLLGILKKLLPKRPDLKVIITSATIDPVSFSRHFDDAPIIEVSGRTYPVEIRYRPFTAEDDPDRDEADAGGGHDDRDDDRTLVDAVSDALDELAREETGDVLVFLSGEAEIRDVADALHTKYADDRSGVTEVLPLYGRLSSADQHKVFQPTQRAGVRRRVVLATNVAETSLTVPGIRYVIDGGTARISRYSTRSKVQRLPIEAISQASANQRSGRSGRTSPGIAIRLYSEDDFLRRPEFTDPEILRTGLAAVILQMVSLGLGDISAFPFLQPPDSRGVRDGIDLLTELGALKRRGQQSGAAGLSLTKIGKDLARIPIDPRFARMVIESRRWNVSREVMAVVSALTIQDPRERPLEKRQQADSLHARFTDPTSDFITLLNLWNYLQKQQAELSSSAFRRMCKREFLNYLRVREWHDVYRQLRRLAKPLRLTINEPSTDADGIHRSLLAGLLSHIGLKSAPARSSQKNGRSQPKRGKKPSDEYIGARGTKFLIFPGSALARKKPDALMSAELVETSRLFARMNAAIDPAWAEKIAGDLCKRSYSEPRWEKRQGAVVADEKVTLYGVPIVPRRRVQYARFDPALCRELFIRHALVEGEWDSPQRFDEKNRRLREELADVEERTRRRNILYDDEAVYEFYDARIPSDVVSTRTFEGWWRKARHNDPDLLTMRAEDLLPDDLPPTDDEAFPGTWKQADQTLEVSYRFDPGADDDGVTVTVPLALLPRLSPVGFDWQVPGLRQELVTALIKSLPKSLRRHIVPAADWAEKLLAELPSDVPQPESTDADSFPAALSIAIKRLAYMAIEADDFDMTKVPLHLIVTFRVIDEKGRAVASGKDLRRLQERLRATTRASVARVAARTPHRLERTGLTRWDIDEIPRFVDSQQAAGVVRGYPALVDTGKTVSLRVLATEKEQRESMRGGLRRLLLMETASPAPYVQQHLSSAEKLTLASSPYRSTTALFEDCMLACVDEAIDRVDTDGLIFSKAEYESLRDDLSSGIVDRMFDTVAIVVRTLEAARQADGALGSLNSMSLLPALSDVKAQYQGLIFPGFVSRTGLAQLPHLPRYLAGISHRLAKLPDNPHRDRAWMLEVQQATKRYEKAGGSIPLQEGASARVVDARWMLEEFRISLFAQPLGTARPVSAKRIDRILKG